MQHQLHQKELALAFEMLYHLALQDYSFRLCEDQPGSMARTLAILLNLLATKLQHGHSNLKGESFAICSLQLNADYSIIGNEAEKLVLFGYPSSVLQHRPLSEIIAAVSTQHFDEVRSGSDVTDCLYTQLHFVEANRIVVAAFCCLKSAGDDSLTLNAIIPILGDGQPQGKKLYNDIVAEISGPYSRDAQLLQNVYDYIRFHTDQPLPSNKQLARMFYTNRQKLKELFRYVLHTSIYQYYNAARLEKARHLIQATHLPLGDIAAMCGFSSFQHFSSLFNRHFGYRPGSMRREF